MSPPWPQCRRTEAASLAAAAFRGTSGDPAVDAAAPCAVGAEPPFAAASFAQRGGTQPWGRPGLSYMRPDGGWRSRCRAVPRSWGNPPGVEPSGSGLHRPIACWCDTQEGKQL